MMTPGKNIVFHFLFWFILSALLLYLISSEFFWFATIGIGTVIVLVYMAFREKGSIRFMPLALVGFLLGFAINYWLI